METRARLSQVGGAPVGRSLRPGPCRVHLRLLVWPTPRQKDPLKTRGLHTWRGVQSVRAGEGPPPTVIYAPLLRVYGRQRDTRGWRRAGGGSGPQGPAGVEAGSGMSSRELRGARAGGGREARRVGLPASAGGAKVWAHVRRTVLSCKYGGCFYALL